MSWEKWVLIAYMMLNAVLTILVIGKPRPPITPDVAVGIMLVNTGLITLVVLA